MHEIQAIIISQEIKENTKKVMMSLNDPLSMQIASFDKGPQRKTIPEKFQRKEYQYAVAAE